MTWATAAYLQWLRSRDAHSRAHSEAAALVKHEWERRAKSSEERQRERGGDARRAWANAGSASSHFDLWWTHRRSNEFSRVEWKEMIGDSGGGEIIECVSA